MCREYRRPGDREAWNCRSDQTPLRRPTIGGGSVPAFSEFFGTILLDSRSSHETVRDARARVDQRLASPSAGRFSGLLNDVYGLPPPPGLKSYSRRRRTDVLGGSFAFVVAVRSRATRGDTTGGGVFIDPVFNTF